MVDQIPLEPVVEIRMPEASRAADLASIVADLYTDRLLETGVTASIGTVGDSYAMAESVNALYKTELVYWERPWGKSVV